MRILTLWQPWASAMALGLKKVETRSWRTPHRCTVAIHAAQKQSVHGILDRLRPDARDRLMAANPLPLGCVVAVGYLEDVVTTQELFRMYPTLDSPTERALGDYRAGRYGWVFKDIVPLKQPLSYRGCQGFRPIPDMDAQVILEMTR